MGLEKIMKADVVFFIFMEDIEKKIDVIEGRNKKVELNKVWEIIFVRKFIIAVLTYFIIVLFFVVDQFPKPFVNSIVPAAGFVLSTLYLPFFKRLWIKCNK